jgi:uncharacterized Zn-binding protein involved in type VI secretion
MMLHVILQATRILRNYCIFFLVIIPLTLSPYKLSHSQDNAKLQELVDKLNRIVKEIENCGNDLDCIDRKSKEMEKIAKQMEEAQKTTPKEQDAKLFNSNIKLGEQTKLPPPFDSITDLWFEHMIASTPYPGKPVDCEKINKTREELIDWISLIYEKEKHIKGIKFPINLSYCNEASVITKEEGKIDVPYGMLLEYKKYTEETPFWIVTYEFFLDKEYFRFGEKLNYRLSEASSVNTLVEKYSGWILDQSVDPPVKLPLNNVSLAREKSEDMVWQFGYSDNTIIYTEILPAGYNSKGEINAYMLQLQYEPIRFYPKGYPELYVESYSGKVFNNISKEDLLSALKKGNYYELYNETDITGTTSTTKEVIITFEPNKCDTINSASKGAIVLSGDCIDHGGHVIASETSFFVNNKPVALIGDEALCTQHGLTKIVTSEILAVVSGNKQVARIGDKTDCGATIIGGSKNTYAGIK